MTYVDQSKIQTLFKPQFINEVFEIATKQSFVLGKGTRLPNMTGKDMEMDILSNLPIAYWAGADTAKRNITSLALKGKRIHAEELNVIIPISKNSIADSNVDLEKIIKERSAEAIAKKLDMAIITGAGKPAGFREGLIPSCVNYGAKVSIDPTAKVPFYDAIDKALAKVETSDYEGNAIVSNYAAKSLFRNMTDTTGQPLAQTEIGSLSREFVANGAWDGTKAVALVGDLKQIYYAIRQEVTVDVLTEGTIENPNDPTEKYNLGQQRMIAIMLTMRMGWEIPNPVSAYNEGNANAFPFAIIQNTGANTEPACTLTVTVKDDASTPAAIEGARVTVAGQEKLTNASGVVTFKVNQGEDYLVAATADNKKPTADVVTVGASATTATLAITLKPFKVRN